MGFGKMKKRVSSQVKSIREQLILGFLGRLNRVRQVVVVFQMEDEVVVQVREVFCSGVVWDWEKGDYLKVIGIWELQ